MTTNEINHTAEINRSYNVRASLPGFVSGHDWSAWGMNHGRTVTMVARRAICHVEAGERVRLVSTSNAGFNGIVGLGKRPGSDELVHMGSLGAWDVAR